MVRRLKYSFAEFKEVWLRPDVYLRMAYDTAAILVAFLLGFLVTSNITVPVAFPAEHFSKTWVIGTAALCVAFGISFNWLLGVYTQVRPRPISIKLATLASSISGAFLVAAVWVGVFRPASLKEFLFLFIAWPIAAALMFIGRLMRERVRQEISRDYNQRMTKERENCVLVIGGAGYIGSALVPRLLKSGYKVIVLDKLYFGEKSIEGFKDHPDVEIVREDLRDVEILVRLVRQSSAIIHLGGLVGDPACAVDADLTIDINVTSTRLIGEIARANGIQRFIFASSCSVYGASHEIVDERSEFNPQSLYARTKVASEAVLSELYNGQFCPTFMRFATIYGRLSSRTRFDLVSGQSP